MKRHPLSGLRSQEVQLIESLAQAIVSGQRSGSVTEKLADGLVSRFGFKFAVATRFSREGGGFVFLGMAPRRKLAGLLNSVLHINPHTFVFPFIPQKQKVLRALARGKCLIGKDLAELVRPVIPARMARTVQKMLGVHSFCACPLMRGSQIIGTILLGQEAESFTSEQRRFLGHVSQYAAVAVQQEEILTKERKTARRYRLLDEVDSHILEEKNLSRVLQAIVRNIHLVVPCDLAGIFLYDEKINMLTHTVSSRDTRFSRSLREFTLPLGKGIIGYAAKTRKPEIINRAHKDRRTRYPKGNKPSFEHLICVPLTASKRLLGVLHISRFTDEPFQPSDLEISKLFAEKSSLAIETATLFARQVDREKELESLQRSGTKIIGSLDLNKVLRSVLEEALRAVPAADRGSIMLSDMEGRELYIAAISGYEKEVKEQFRLGWGRGLGGRVVRTRKGVLIEDVKKTPYFVELPVKHAGPEVRSVIAVPLLSKNRAIGVVNLDSTRGPSAFTARDLARLELFAVHAALAVSNAQLHASVQQEVKKIRLLRRIKDAAQQVDASNAFLVNVCRFIVEEYQYNLTCVMMYNPDRRVLKLAAAGGSEASHIRHDFEQSLEVGVVGWVGRKKKCRMVQDVSKDSFFVNRNRLSTKAELCVPILDARGGLIGVLNTESNRPYPFSESDLQMMLAVASEIAGAIAEQKLVAALRSSEKQYRSLVEYANDAVVLIGVDGKFRFVNRMFVTITGYSPKEVIGKNYDIILDPNEQGRVREWMAASLKRRAETSRARLTILTKEGKKRVVDYNGRLLREGRAISGILGIARDVTNEIDLRRKLAESELRHSHYIMNTGEGIWYAKFDPPIDLSQSDREILRAYKKQLDIIEVNKAFAQMHGFASEEEFVQSGDFDIVADWDVYNRGVLEFLRNGCRLVNWETIERDRHGTIKWFRNNYFGEVNKGTLERMWGSQTDISGQKRVEQALHESEKKFRTLFEKSKDAIYISTPEGRLLDINEAGVELFGYENKEELMKADIARDLYADPVDRNIILREVDQKGFLKNVELRLKKKNGEQILVHENTSVLKDPRGHVVAYQGILRDITKVKENARILHESEEKYRSLVEDSLVGVYVIQDAKFTFVNKRFTEIFGYDVEEILTRVTVADLVIPEDRPIVMENIRKRIDREVKSIRYSFRGLRKDGTHVEVEVYGTGSMYLGRPAVIGTILDRTQERRSEREIADWRQRYDLIIASSGQMVYEYDIKRGTILWSGSIEKVLGYKLGELRGDIEEWVGMIHPDDAGDAFRLLEECQARLEPYDIEYRFRKKDGTYVWMHDRGFFLGDDAGAAVKMLGMMEDVTSRKELERRVISSELKHRLLFEHNNDAVFVMRNEIFIDCNPKALEMFACQRADVIGQTMYDFSSPRQPDGQESKTAALQRIRAALEGLPQQFFWRHVKRNGTAFAAEVRLNRFELEGEVLVQAQVRDITAELEVQEELARSEEKYRQLVQEAGEAILVTDGDGRLVEVNDKACQLLGFTRSELLNMNVSDLADPPREEALAAFRRFYKRLILENNIVAADQWMKKKDGTHFPYQINAVLLGNGMLQAIIRDISEERRAEQELDQIYAIAATMRGQELFDRAATIIAQMLNMRYVVVGEILENNTLVRALTMFQKGKLIRGFEYSLVDSPCFEVREKQEMCVFSERVRERFSKDRVLVDWEIESYIGVPMMDSKRGTIGLVCAFDERRHTFSDHERKILSIIAQRLASELEMLIQMKREDQLSHQLLQSQKMESLGTLAGGIAHDFNNILGAVLGYTSLIKKQIEPSSNLGRYLDAIEKSSQRAAALSKQLLSFAHKTQGDIRPVSMNDVIEETIHIIGSSFPKNISVKTDLSPSVPLVMGDQGQLGQVMMNLCINARDAIVENAARTEAGLLTITTSHFKASAGFVDLHLSAAPGEYVCISVVDNGIGMKQEIQQRIFEPFFTTKGKGRGTGLGLAMVYGIVRNHNGFIDVSSEVGYGTACKVYLPAAEHAERVEQSTPDEQVLQEGHGEIILVVDDEPMLRELVADVLSTQGYNVMVAANGKEAVDIYRQQQQRIQLVLLDMIMPEMDGPSTFHALRQMNPEAKILISSGFSQDDTVQRLLSSGATGFVGKPYQTDDLLKLVGLSLKP